MALLLCHECKNEVSSEARTCPKCGAKVKKPKGSVAKIILIIFATLIVLFVLSMFGSNPKQSNNDASSCHSNYHFCKDNEDLINNYDPLVIHVAKRSCKSSVDEYVKFGSPEWDSDNFGRFLVGNDFVKTGIIKIADNNVKIENMYGAKARTQVGCSYDLESKKVLEIMVDGEFVTISIKPTANTTSNNTNEVEGDDSTGSSEVASLDTHPVATEQELQQIKPFTYAAETLNKTCRKAIDNTIEKIQVCNARDDAVQKLKNYGWCWNQGSEIDPDKQWVKCGNGEKNNADALTNNVITTQTANLDVKEDSSAEPKISSDKELPKNQDNQHHFYVQIGVFSEEANVKLLQDKLSDLGYKSQAEIIDTDRGKKNRLRTEEFNNSKEAYIALENIKGAGLSGMVLSQ